MGRRTGGEEQEHEDGGDKRRLGQAGVPMTYPSNDEWINRITRLEETLAVCPTDMLARSELATLLEQLDQPEEALFNWNAILVCNPNHLNAREGVARCRRRIGRSLQSNR